MELLHEFFHPVFARTYRYARNEEDRCIYVRSKNTLDGPWTEWECYEFFRVKRGLEKYGLPTKLNDN